MKQPYKFMFSRMRDTAAVLDETTCRVMDKLVAGLKLVREDLVDLSETQAGGGVGVGRVHCDSEGRLNSNSVMVHGSLDWSAGLPVPLDLSQAPAYSLFPGQVVALDCSNPTGAKLISSKVYEGVMTPPGSCLLDTTEPLTLLSAAGPYTTMDSTSHGEY